GPTFPTTDRDASFSSKSLGERPECYELLRPSKGGLGRRATPSCAPPQFVIKEGKARKIRASPRNFKETQPMRSKTLLLGSFIALLAVPAMAQGNNAINLVGTVDKVDATSITVKTEESTETVKIAPNVLYLQNKPAKLTDIKSNDFVAS